IGEVLADEAIEQGAEHVLLEVPAIDGTAHVIGNIPDLALQRGALFVACYSVVPDSIRRLLFIQSTGCGTCSTRLAAEAKPYGVMPAANRCKRCPSARASASNWFQSSGGRPLSSILRNTR